MTCFRCLVLFVVATVLTVSLAATDRVGEQKLQQAIDLIESKGDLAKATPLFEEVAKSGDRTLAARALLHLAQAQERFGKGEARATYQRLVTEFGGATETSATTAVVTAASTRLAATGQNSDGLTATRVWDSRANAVSPDGRYLVFRDDGNLALRDLTSGRNRSLTTTAQWNDRFAQGGVPSPDSLRIAYGWFDQGVAGFELRVISRDGGKPATVYSAKENAWDVMPWAWTADGKRILATLGSAAATRSPRDLALISVETGAVQLVKHFDTGVAANYALSPDGRSVAYDRPVNPGSPRRGVFSLSIDTGEEVPMFADAANSTVLGWFSTGDRILFASDRGGTTGIWASRIVGGRGEGEPTLVHAISGTVWALGFTTRGDFYYSSPVLESEVYLASIDPATGRVASPPTRLQSRFVALKRQAAWSPTGDRLAFVQDPPSGSVGPMRDQKLAIQSVATGDVRLLPVPLQNMQNPAWLPDGRAVVVQGRDRNGQHGLHVVNLETGAVAGIIARTAADDSRRSLAVPSTDGRVFFRSAPAASTTDAGSISAIHLTSGVVESIASEAVGGMALSPDGQWLAVTNSSAAAISIIRSAGGAPRPIPAGGRGWSVLEPVAWSSDGRFVFIVTFAVKSGTAVREVWQVPFDGSEPRSTGIHPSGNVTRISSHPDGRRLAISTQAGSGETWVLKNLPSAAATR